jgi:D-serine deaminase-like pyridoxal phosphate-dependent protein
LVTDGDTVRRLDLELESDIDVWIEVDAGYHRTGVSVWDVEAIDLVLGELELCRHLRFRGFVLHAGNTYSARDASEVLKIHGQALGAFVGLGRRYRPRYPDLLLSYGDTPSASLATDFEGIDELRPGVFVFHDLMMQQLGACRYSDIALAVYAPVIGVYVQRNEVVVHAGAVHFSKDFLIHPDNGRPMYGLLLDEHTWMPSQGGGYLSKLSQEHGTLSLPEGLAAGYHVGQWVLAAPVHACLTADMFEAYYTTQGTKIERL